MSTDFSQRYDWSMSTRFSSKLRGNCPCILLPCHLSFVFSAILSFTFLVSFCTSVFRHLAACNTTESVLCWCVLTTCISLLLILLLLRSVHLLTFLSVSLAYLRQSQSRLCNHRYTLPRALLSIPVRSYLMPFLLRHIFSPTVDSNVSAPCHKSRILMPREKLSFYLFNSLRKPQNTRYLATKNKDILKSHL